MDQEQGYATHGDFQVFKFYCSFYTVKVHLSDGINREWNIQIQTSNSLSILAQGFLSINTDSWVNSTILILLLVKY